MPSTRKSTSVTSIILSLILLNAAGLLAVYLKLASDMRQVSSDLATTALRIQANSQRSRVLAFPNDGSFVLRGKGVCDGVYRISGPVESVQKDGDLQRTYDLSYPFGPEDSDLGMVVVENEPTGQQKTTLSTEAFREHGRAVSYVLTMDGKLSDCTLSIAAR